MEELAVRRALRLMFQIWKQDKSRASFHYAFAIKKSKVVAIGKNNISDGSKTALQIGRSLNITKWKEYPYIHAECDALSKLMPLKNKKRLENINLLVVRLSSKNKIQSSKPCVNCIEAMKIMPERKGYKIENIYYSDADGNIIKTNLKTLDAEEKHFSKYFRRKRS